MSAACGVIALAFCSIQGGPAEAEPRPTGPDRGARPWGRSLAWGDYDGDGREDLYVVDARSGDRLHRNEGGGRFSDVTAAVGLSGADLGCEARWIDFDLDGDLDLFAGSHGRPARLFCNVAGAFEEITERCGLASSGAVLESRWLDFDADGRLDLELTTASSSLLFHNSGAAGFVRVELDLPGALLDASALAPTIFAESYDTQTAFAPLQVRGSARVPSFAPSDRSAAATSAGSSGPPLSLVCAEQLVDKATGQCGLAASSVPMLGMLYPQSLALNVDSAGRVGINTTAPGERLTVAGVIHATVDGFRFPDGSIQHTAVSGGGSGVPSGYMIAGNSQTVPDGYTYSGLELGIHTWRARASMLAGRSEGAAAHVTGRIYAIGGRGSSGVLAAVEEYDPSTDSWTSKAPMPTARDRLAAVEVGGKIYAVGGSAGATNDLTVLEEYDPATNTWTGKAPMPTGRGYLAAAEAGGRLYVLGGQNESGPLATVEEYDPLTDTWRIRTPMSVARFQLAAAGAGGRVYAIGGTNSGALATVEEYDPSTDTWTSKTSMPTGRARLAAAELSGRISAIGGAVSSTALAVVEEYDPATDTWTSRSPMPTARFDPAAAAAAGRIYAIGGRTSGSGGPVSTVEEYSPWLYFHRKD